jgi:molybdopterin/thiamine biosynthesis adenylyltransferase
MIDLKQTIIRSERRMGKRYIRNMKTLSEEENKRLKEFRVFVAGCGGLGGFIIEELARLGIGYITAVDGDSFDETNLNRQLLATMDTLGRSKAETASRRIEEVNPEIVVRPINSMIDEENCAEMIRGHHLVFDALDNAGTRRIIEKNCEKENIPMIHGAIGGWYGQVASIFPGDKILERLYPHDIEKGIEEVLGNPAFTPAVVASIQVAEGLKVLLNRGKILRRKLLCIDLLMHEYECMDLG